MQRTMHPRGPIPQLATIPRTPEAKLKPMHRSVLEGSSELEDLLALVGQL
jgi:hypothetical protein